jgi:hypothetical protein
MISPVLQTLIDKLAADGRVSAAEVLEVRALVYADGQIGRAEAEALFALNERVAGDDQAWLDLFAEALCDHLMEGGEERGHVSEEGAAWLEARIDRDGVLERETELNAVLKVLDRAESCPDRLQTFARTLISRAVLEGKGYVGRDAAQAPGQIGETELALIRRALYASAGAGDAFVTRQEAEWLFDLDAATDGRAHCAGWRDLFVGAVMNHLFAAGPSDLLGRGAMMERAQWLKTQQSRSVGAFYNSVFGGGFKGLITKFYQESPQDAVALHALAREEQGYDAARLEAGEASWLVHRIEGDGRKTANERALIAAVKDAQGEDALKSA